jgi:UDP-3-O-[3-hydroxymyristoyl] glucosamine N-acyltransferase LpxD
MTKVSTIASFLNKEFIGEDVDILFPRFLENIEPFALVFATNYSDETCNLLNRYDNLLVIANVGYLNKLRCSHIFSDNPRLDFSKVFSKFWHEDMNEQLGISSTAIIGKNSHIADDCYIGEYVIIGNNVKIGHGSKIYHHTVVMSNTEIGNNCLIEAHCVLGQSGWWFTKDENNHYLDLPHLGKVVVGDNVSIGSYTNVDRGILPITNTVIENNVRINDKVHIGHGVKLMRNARIAVGCHICGEVEIGEFCWLGPGSVVRNSLKICANVTVGMNSVVTKSIDLSGTYIGVPARYAPGLKQM